MLWRSTRKEKLKSDDVRATWMTRCSDDALQSVATAEVKEVYNFESDENMHRQRVCYNLNDLQPVRIIKMNEKSDGESSLYIFGVRQGDGYGSGSV